MAVSFYVGRAFTSSGMDSARPVTALPSPGLAVGRGGGAPAVPPAGGGRVIWNRKPRAGMCLALVPRAALRNRWYAMMVLQLRLLLLTVLRSASVGVVAGIAVAAREILAQDYLRQHLWRTALWIACRDTALGALVGAAGGACLGERRTVRALVPLRRTAGDSRVPCIRTSSRDLCGHARGDASTS
jgi:hypothetical protein